MRVLVAALLLASSPLSAQSAAPAVTLWLWHGAHDLRGVRAASEQHFGVAYLARTIIVERDGIAVTPRRDAILLDDETPRSAVVHMELGRGVDVATLHQHRGAILRAVTPIYEEAAGGIQFDFDAPRSMRGEYAHLLQAIASAKPRAWSLSITALGSWCTADRWLAVAPVDFVVPMLFGPGHDRHETLRALDRGPLAEPLCRDALGVREGQEVPQRHRIYVFGQGPWTRARAIAAITSAS